MQAITLSEVGNPDVLQREEQPRPQAGRGNVLIKVAAAGVNRADILQRKGKYPPPPGASNLLGLEVAGKVVETGEGVDFPPVGMEVCALLTGGGYAEYCTAEAPLCLPIPKGISLTEAATLPEALFTVWGNVFERGRLAPGETLLVQGGSSGIGVMAIQLAHALGSTVYATAGSDEKCAACERLGASIAVNYHTRDFAKEIKKATVDVILDMVGGDYVPKELALLKEEGRLVFIGAMGGTDIKASIREIMARRLTVTGSTLRNRSTGFKKTIAEALRKKVWPLLEKREVLPVLFKTFPFDKAADAHRLLESSHHIGKIALSF